MRAIQPQTTTQNVLLALTWYGHRLPKNWGYGLVMKYRSEEEIVGRRVDDEYARQAS